VIWILEPGAPKGCYLAPVLFSMMCKRIKAALQTRTRYLDI
jgi:hypothetical protein